MRLPGAGVGGGQPRRHLDVAQLAGLGVDEAHVAERARIAIGLGRDVDDEHVVPERAQDLQAGLEAAGIQEIGNDHGQPHLPRPRRELLERLAQIGRAAGFEALEQLEHAEDAPLAAPGRRLVAEAAPNGRIVRRSRWTRPM